MTTKRLIFLLGGLVAGVLGLVAFIGGVSLASAYAFARDADGFFTSPTERIASGAPVVVADDIDLRADPGDPDWVFDAIDLDVRLEVTPTVADREMFIGIAPAADVDAFLAGVARDRVVDVEPDVAFDRVSGASMAPPPASTDVWAVQSLGPGVRDIIWQPEEGEWAVVVMNGDGSAGVAFDVEAGARSDVVVPIFVATIILGLALGALALVLVLASGAGREPVRTEPHAAPATPRPPQLSPVQLDATLDPQLSTWKWLVKWLLAIPHWIVLALLWVVFVLTTIAAGIAILFTGRYPRGIFDLNVGILRWSWRVSYYATNGGIGSDVYPHFGLDEAPGDHARLHIAYPEQLSRPMVLVKWLLALPHLLIVGILAGGSLGWSQDVDYTFAGGLLGLLALIAGVILLFTGAYPRALFDLIVGLNRWVYRTVAYVALMTDEYPPFRLDQGGDEPVGSSGPDDGDSSAAPIIDLGPTPAATKDVPAR